LCEIHHLDGGWKLGTPTDLHKLAPACGWHNRWVEDHADQITQTRDTRGRAVVRILPPWTTHPDSTTTNQRQTTTSSRQPGAP
ncbi:MAG: hypothetical protein JWN52_2810, partial [Actinomycetia bacterium]|nr:hypothetical protein [Actinomycetes bacterium]